MMRFVNMFSEIKEKICYQSLSRETTLIINNASKKDESVFSIHTRSRAEISYRAFFSIRKTFPTDFSRRRILIITFLDIGWPWNPNFLTATYMYEQTGVILYHPIRCMSLASIDAWHLWKSLINKLGQLTLAVHQRKCMAFYNARASIFQPFSTSYLYVSIVISF